MKYLEKSQAQGLQTINVCGCLGGRGVMFVFKP